MWAGAKNIISTMEGVLLGLEAISMVARRQARPLDILQNAVHASESLEAVNELVVTIIEATQGKINGEQLIVAMRVLMDRLDAGDPIPVALDAMRTKL